MTSWEVTDSNGAVHTITCKVGGKTKITVDGELYKVKSSNWFINIVDYEIDIPGANCHVVAIGKNIDLAVNGVYRSNGDAYEPVSNLPAWVWVLVALSVIGGFFCGGVLCMAIGCIFSTLYVQFAVKKQIKLTILMFAVFLFIAGIWAAALLWLIAEGILEPSIFTIGITNKINRIRYY